MKCCNHILGIRGCLFQTPWKSDFPVLLLGGSLAGSFDRTAAAQEHLNSGDHTLEHCNTENTKRRIEVRACESVFKPRLRSAYVKSKEQNHNSNWKSPPTHTALLSKISTFMILACFLDFFFLEYCL